jgi:hypothetical protein
MFQLQLLFTSEDLQNIYATGSSVAVAKSFGSSKPTVIWQLFKPFQANTFQFAEEYGIYGSYSQPIDGTSIVVNTKSEFPAAQNKLYTLISNGNIVGPSEGGIPSGYALLNEYSFTPIMTIGLFQNAIINGQEVIGNTISANSVLLNSTITMKPSPTLYLWIESEIESNAMLNNVTSPMTKVQFGEGINQISLKYDHSTGTFISV